MSRISARAGASQVSEPAGFQPVKMAKSQFANRLWNLMVAKGWTQADLGRRAGLGRDQINTYVHGRSLPTPENAKRLADALGIAANQLYPGAEADFSPTGPGLAPFEMRTTTPGKMFVRVNLELPFDAAGKIFQLLQECGAIDSK
jgi:transcriptional regulator with XRE-family HTH domain